MAAEPIALRRILGNLIDNAVRHGGGEITVRANPDPSTAGLVRIDVIDDGPGIRADELPTIFQRFYKSDRSRSSGGSGLGLAIAHEHALRQGGQLTAGNERGRGARFTLILRQAEPQPDAPEHGAPSPGADPVAQSRIPT